MIPEDLKCEVCSSAPAKLVCLRRRQDDLHRMFVCSYCADERAQLYASANLDFQHILARMQGSRADGKSGAYTCRLCGTTLAEIITDGKPGCCLCYLRFSGEIEPLTRAAQNHTRHVGKAPAI